MNNSSKLFKEIVEKLIVHPNKFSLKNGHRIQKKKCCILFCSYPLIDDNSLFFSSYVRNSFKRSKVDISFHKAQLDEIIQISVAVVFSRKLYIDKTFPRLKETEPEIFAICPYAEDEALLKLSQCLPNDVTTELNIGLAVENSSKTLRILKGNPIDEVLDGNITLSSYSNTLKSLSKIHSKMQNDLAAIEKKELNYFDEIPTFWGFKLTFLPPATKQRNYWIYGPSNLGKSFFARWLKVEYRAACCQFFTGTQAEVDRQTQIIILDEFKRTTSLPFAKLNILCDGQFPFKHLYIDNFKTIDSIIVVMTNDSITTVYPEALEDPNILAQLNNRFIEINLEQELKMQGISDYLTSRHKASDELVQRVFTPSVITSLSNHELVDRYLNFRNSQQNLADEEADENSLADYDKSFVESEDEEQLEKVLKEARQELENPESRLQDFQEIEEEEKEMSLNSGKTYRCSSSKESSDLMAELKRGSEELREKMESLKKNLDQSKDPHGEANEIKINAAELVSKWISRKRKRVIEDE